MNLPENVKKIINVIEDHGQAAYAVGGCVRDSILGKEPHDWDITTSAKPEEVKQWFKKTFDTGIEHGTVTVLLGGEGYEITTYRIDGKYEDGRHPKEVTFTASLEEDLKRRDFTINAMAYNEKDGLVDLFDGIGDLKRGIIRAVGNPKERFSEDALRMLRALRFAAQLGFEIDQPTLDAIKELSPTLEKISAERIQVELVKLVTSDHPEKIRDVYTTGLTKVFMPEFDRMMETDQVNKHHMYSVGEHTIHAMMVVPADKILRLTMMLHDVAKPVCITTDENGQNHFKGHDIEGAEIARKILKRLKFDNDTIDQVVNLIRHHDERPEINIRNVRRMVVRVGDENFNNLLEVKKADCLAQSMYKREFKLKCIEELGTLYEQIKKENDCISIKDLKVNGRDLLEIGVPQGQEIGRVLKGLFEEVLEDPSLNNRDYLISRAKDML